MEEQGALIGYAPVFTLDGTDDQVIVYEPAWLAETETEAELMGLSVAAQLRLGAGLDYTGRAEPIHEGRFLGLVNIAGVTVAAISGPEFDACYARAIQ